MYGTRTLARAWLPPGRTAFRAAKPARNITVNTTILIPEKDVPSFKPSKEFTAAVKK